MTSETQAYVGLLTLFGLAFGGHGLIVRARGKRTIRWKPAPAKIVWSMMDERIVTKGRGAVLRSEHAQYRPDVRYWYKVGGIEHECSQVFVGDREWTYIRPMAQATLDKYPVGRELRAFHNPSKPEEAVLERGQVRGSTKFLMIGIALLIAAALMALGGP